MITIDKSRLRELAEKAKQGGYVSESELAYALRDPATVLALLDAYEALQAECEEFKNKAHEWVRSGLELVDNAPRRFDFYYQKIEALRSDRDQQYDMKVKARAQRDEAARMLKAKEAENFALAATACHGGYGDDFGHFRCNYQDEIRKLQAECEKLRKEAETERAIQCAAEVLPLGFSIEIEIERDAGTVALFGPGPSVSCDFHGSIAEQINEAIDAAMQENKSGDIRP